jgi:acetaldehyde dehydrogenase / alcohol dehydrogenase
MVLATGGNAMVKSAYSSGHPAIGVGAGNVPVIIDETANVYQAVKDILESKGFDHGLLCTSEQTCIVVESAYEEVMAQFDNYDIHIATPEECQLLRQVVVVLPNGTLNPAIVGQSPHVIGQLAGFPVSPTARIILAPIEGTDNMTIGKLEPLSYEKLSPILAITKVPDVVRAIAKAKELVAFGGMGHTAALHTGRFPLSEPTVRLFESTIPTCRLIVNQPSTQGALGFHYNTHWPPSLMMGCGTFGGNSVCGNITPMHLLNVTTTIYRGTTSR